ncbi:hypothetical protein [Bacillus sp. UNC438CL73TsuS30]|uniref:hypothetical protein n=1 Tax=Bacillus sp. UNC438CL73TsuS30 TaxID=1340434 RepID=UPI00047C7D5D|nr:hypothetical protein [Bacillus sp. UNC438CL73TsuS30]
MFELSLIKKNLKYGEEIEGKEYAHKVLSLEDVKWLIEQAEKVEELQSRIDKVLEQSGVNWINKVLKGVE